MTDIKPRLTLAPLPTTRRGYGININVSPKDNRLVYTNGRLVILRSIDNPADTLVFTEHKCNVNVATFSPSGYWVASGDEEGTVIVWSYPSMKVKNTVRVGKSILDIDWDADSTRIVAAGDGAQNKAKVFQYDSGNNLGEITMHNLPILSCSYRKARPFRIATASEDLSVNFYEGPPFKYNSSFKGHTRYPNCVRFSPDGNYYASVGADAKIVLYDGKTGEMKKEIENAENGHKGSIYSFSWSLDGKQIVTASADKTAKIWDIESGTVVKTWNFGNDLSDQQVGALWTKSTIITVSLSGAINYLDPKEDKPTKIIHGHQSTVTSIAVDTAKNTLYSAGISGEVCKWDLKTGISQWLQGKGPEKIVTAIALDSKGDMLYTFSYDNRVRANSTQKWEWAADSYELGGVPVSAVAAKKDAGLAVAILSNDKAVVLRDGRVASQLDLAGKPTAVCFSPCDSKVLIGTKEKALLVFGCKGDKLTKEKEIKEHDKSVTAMDFSNDGNLIVSTDKDASVFIRLADSFENKSKNGWRFHSACIQTASFSTDGSRLATGSLDTHIIIWNDLKEFVSGARTKIELAHSQGVELIRWVDDKSFISVGSDRTIRIWDAPKK